MFVQSTLHIMQQSKPDIFSFLNQNTIKSLINKKYSYTEKQFQTQFKIKVKTILKLKLSSVHLYLNWQRDKLTVRKSTRH